MKILRKFLCGGIILILSSILTAGFVSCASDDDDDNMAATAASSVTATENVTVTLVSEVGTAGISYTIEKGKTLASISNYAEPAKSGYTFAGWQDSDGNAYSSSSKITKSVMLYAKWESESVTVPNADGTTTTTTKSQNADGSETTEENKTDSDGKTIEKKTTTIKSDGTEITKTKTSEETTTETVEKDANGKTTRTTIVTETQDGNVTTTVKDASGKVISTDTKQKEYKQYIDAGIKALENATPDYDEAVSNFNKAYSAEVNDETRVYSALASLASLSTKSATSDFVKNHLGITNYPSTMNSLFDPGWLEAAEYIDYEDEDTIMGYIGDNVFSKSSPSSSSDYYRASIEPVEEIGGENVVWFLDILTPVKVSGTATELSSSRQTKVDNATIYALGTADYYKATMKGYPDDYEEHWYYKYTLDDNGDYYVRVAYGNNTQDLSSHQSYKLTSNYQNQVIIQYTYNVKTKFAKLSVPEWFKDSSLSNDFVPLLAANILNGNTKGLNNALDDFYNLIFDSDEYKNAIEKIDEITSSVTVPSNVIEDFGLTDIVGDSAVKLGPAELKLVKTAFTALKAGLEYFQSYDFDVADASFLKFPWADKIQARKVFDKYLDYDSAVDPLKSNFLKQRDASKMSSAKAGLVQAIGDLISAYDDILNNSYDYPTAAKDKLSDYSILKNGAKLLKAAVSDGGKFYIPNVETMDELTLLSSWPTSGKKYIDFGKLFDADNFALKNFISTSNDKVNVYNLEKLDDKTRTDSTVLIFLNGNPYVYQTYETYYKTVGKYSYSSSDEIDDLLLGIKLNFTPIQNVLVGFDDDLYLPVDVRSDSSGCYYAVVKLPSLYGVYVYNFYNGGAAKTALTNYMDSYFNN